MPRTSRRRFARAAASAVLAATVAVLVACSSSGNSANSTVRNTTPAANASGSNKPVSAAFNNATIGVVNASTKTGGTLRLIAQADCDSWDPAVTYYGWCWTMQRLFTRTLVGYSALPGANNVKVEPDLATGLGAHNAAFTQWTYHLKPGLSWENGTPITTKDIKYGIERLFATDVINGGPTSYFQAVIQHPSGYAGVYKSGDLSSIQTPDDRTIVFNLSVPYSDFDYLMTLPASAPVPAGVEGGPGGQGASYGLHPASSGPYKIESYQPKAAITFVRNPKWSAATDTIRRPLADRVTLTVDSSATDVGQRLLAGSADAEVDTNVDQTAQAKIATDPTLKANADDPVTGYTQYIVVNQTVAPLDNIHCRLAVFYAADKDALVRARGGSYGGSLANTMTPPTVPGYDAKADPYPAPVTGDLAKAKSQLQQCGKPSGFTTKLAYPNSGRGPAVYDAMRQALARVGISAQAAPSDPATYYSRFIGSPQNIVTQQLGLAEAGWAADFPTGYGFWNSISNGAAILPTGNSNYASLNDPVVNGILDAVTKSSGTHADQFAKLDAQVMKDAVMMPYVYNKSLFYRNPRLTNVYTLFATGGYYDSVNMGTSDGK